ncbi:uncharacterized protein FOMMEDRAFT_156734 [Fomitiporia mediterranea MF3/22]|uniref:uncharacterized protein n=1 Tax=Fomitiporia mediterranea (strain MF3/22) TaxID=694068 RepID=UPI0004407FF5|nr:uncharacterized protein FOMMEDRAFT_156734 [Fomitiporia mediterranea MF3/22]EJD03343.1 hypothetical protein FOMMEDRAFT_156734 [Fomitiporia mediterranea MF3/22]
MPKTLQSQPPSPVKQPANAPAPDKLDKMSEITLRKKKNADAQAAFRARRANYIATLEETGPSAAKYLNIHVPTTKSYTPYTPYTEVAYRIWVLLTQFTPVIIRAYAYTWEILRA